jgi:hypothetical protein
VWDQIIGSAVFVAMGVISHFLHNPSDWEAIRRACNMPKPDHKPTGERRWQWALAFCFGGVSPVVALIASASVLPYWAINTLVGFAGICFFISAYLFGWLRIRGSIVYGTRTVSVAAIIVIAMAVLRSEVWPKPPIVEISKEIRMLSIPIAPGTQVYVGVIKDGFEINFATNENSSNNYINWVNPCHPPQDRPPFMFEYHVFNHNSYSIGNLKATFLVTFMDAKKSTPFEVYMAEIPANGSWPFYIVNESRYPVTVDSTDTIELQIPGEDKRRVPVLHGKVTMGAGVISDIGSFHGIDWFLGPTIDNWDNSDCPTPKPQPSKADKDNRQSDGIGRLISDALTRQLEIDFPSGWDLFTVDATQATERKSWIPDIPDRPQFVWTYSGQVTPTGDRINVGLPGIVSGKLAFVGNAACLRREKGDSVEIDVDPDSNVALYRGECFSSAGRKFKIGQNPTMAIVVRILSQSDTGTVVVLGLRPI